jgi:hypothetical protein
MDVLRLEAERGTQSQGTSKAMSQPVRKLVDHFAETIIEDEVIVMRLDDGDFFSLTETARDIWQLIDGTRTRDELVEAMAELYRASPEEIAGEVDEFLASLIAAGLIAKA